MRRREVITLVGAAAVWSSFSRAQPAMPTVGYLGSASSELSAKAVRAFRDGLSEVGYVEGRNVTIEYRWADGQNNRLPGLAADLVRHRVRVLVGPGSTPARLGATP